MKDIPVFTTEYGAASLILREIPYSRQAYIRLQASDQPLALAAECAAFCRACGAETVYAAGHAALESFPLHTAILRMARSLKGLPDTDAALWPVQPETLPEWLTIYNRRMAGVANAAWMTEAAGREMLVSGDAYFIHRGDTLLGIGRVHGEALITLAAVQPGAGRDVVLSLAHAAAGDRLLLEVASANLPALRLYESLGFLPIAEISRWYKIL